MTTLRNLVIASAQGDYPVEFAPTVEDALGMVSAIADPFLLVDRNLLAIYPVLNHLLSSRRHLLLDATENEKTLDGVRKVVDWLQDNNCTKKSTVVAIGGGIIQDLATFSSHIYYRGVPWTYVPTTLLSMSDSCIGAKCGINLNEFKNQLGVFQSPNRVVIATDFTKTLADQDVASGHGEILKLLLTGPAEGFTTLRTIIERDGLRTAHLPELVHASLSVKKQVIEADEYESDYRRILNYGHTFGHALESLTAHEVPHGLGVAWGIDLVNHIAVARGLLDASVFADVHDFVTRFMPFRLSSPVTASALIAAARRDKKASGDSVNLVLLAKPGDLRIVKVSLDADLEQQVTGYLEHYDAFRCN